MTKKVAIRLVLGLTILCATGRANATMRVVQKEISVSRALAGHVLVRGTDEPVSGVTVELCSAGWKTVFASTKTDGKGYFSLRRPSSKKLFYIRVTAPGMDIYELRVRIDEHAAEELTIHLSVAT